MARITLHNPQAPELSLDTGELVLPSLRGSRAGVLTNGKQNSELVMTAILQQLGGRYEVANPVVCRTASGRLRPEIVDELVRQCDWVIVGSSD